MISTSQKARASVAAEMHLRDRGHLAGPVRCAVQVKYWKANTLLAACNRPSTTQHDGMLMVQRYDRTPFVVDAGATTIIRALRTSIGRNQRLAAVFDLAIATQSTLSFAHARGSLDQISVDCDVVCTEGRSPEALDAAARWLRIEHAEAAADILRRTHERVVDFRMDYPGDPAECIAAVAKGLAEMARWAQSTGSAPAPRVSADEDPLTTLRRLLDEIPAGKLARRHAVRLNEARAIVGRMMAGA